MSIDWRRSIELIIHIGLILKVIPDLKLFGDIRDI